MSQDLIFESVLNAPTDEVWRRVTSVDGIADELSPLVRMTFPKTIRELTEQTVPIGRRLCRSWILLFGFIPIDYDDVTIVALEPGRRFLERSPTATQREWVHERSVEPTGDGCVLTDRLQINPRLSAMRGLIRLAVRTLFSHRHARLVQRLGGSRRR